MHRSSTVVLLALALAAPGCKRNNQNANAPGVIVGQPMAQPMMGPNGQMLMPEHGGTLGTNQGYVTEVVPAQNGMIQAYVRGPQGPVQDADVLVSLRNADGSQKPVTVAYDAQTQSYVGFVTGTTPGMKTVDVTVAPPVPNAAPAMVSSQVMLPAVATPPPARHGGTVEFIGEHAVEIVPVTSGDVAFYVMDTTGNPIPPSEVELPAVAVTPPGAPVNAPAQPVVVQPAGDHFVGHGAVLLGSVPAAAFNLHMRVRGRLFSHAHTGGAAVVSAPQPGVIVDPPGRDIHIPIGVPSIGIPHPGIVVAPGLPHPGLVHPGGPPHPGGLPHPGPHIGGLPHPGFGFR